MSWIDLLFISAVALVCGLIGQLTSKYSHGGCIVNLGVAFVGAVLGVHFSRTLGFNMIYTITIQKTDFPLIWALLGSVLSVAAISLFFRPGRR